uniref:Uncharacterized protein n=1 Tax=Arabidopsis thaliana TaxID=3702 RepID=Q0WVF9_ARATH|nr:hypothetical protein [Arabidopsis thaliana]
MQRLARVRPAIKSFLNKLSLYCLPQLSIGKADLRQE